MVQTIEGAVVRKNDSFIVPHEEVPGLNPGRGKQLVFFKVSSKLTIIYTLRCTIH